MSTEDFADTSLGTMTSLVAGVSGTSSYRKSTNVSSHESLLFDSLKDKFETLNKWVIKLGTM